MGGAFTFRPWQGRILASINESPIAWLDPETGAVLSAARPVQPEELQTAFLAWRDGWHDLAQNKPGQQVIETATRKRREMSRLRLFAAWHWMPTPTRGRGA